MDPKDEVVTALEEFEQKASPTDPVPEILERHLSHVAKTGETIVPWDKLKPLFLHKLNLTMIEFYEKVPTDHLLPSPNVENVHFDEIKSRILDMAATFTGAPFTIQRLCELLTNPLHHYKRTDKFLRGLEKNILVVSTVDPKGNKVINDTKMLSNGLETNGMEKTPEKLDSPFVPPPPYNSPMVVKSIFDTPTTESQSSLVQSWPTGEGSSASSSAAVPSSSSSEADAAPGTSMSFEDYMPPDKKARLEVAEESDKEVVSPSVSRQETEQSSNSAESSSASTELVSCMADNNGAADSVEMTTATSSEPGAVSTSLSSSSSCDAGSTSDVPSASLVSSHRTDTILSSEVQSDSARDDPMVESSDSLAMNVDSASSSSSSSPPIPTATDTNIVGSSEEKSEMADSSGSPSKEPSPRDGIPGDSDVQSKSIEDATEGPSNSQEACGNSDDVSGQDGTHTTPDGTAPQHDTESVVSSANPEVSSSSETASTTDIVVSSRTDFMSEAAVTGSEDCDRTSQESTDVLPPVRLPTADSSDAATPSEDVALSSSSSCPAADKDMECSNSSESQVSASGETAEALSSLTSDEKNAEQPMDEN